ncbi:tetratricopeptide repeat protein, partial [Streptomyces sp. 900105755]
MAQSRPSRQELNRRRRRGGFIGRRGELSVFRENLERDPEDEAFQYLFHVHGQAGVGKTSLLRQWETAARERGAVTVYLDDDVHSVIEAMESISAQLGRQQVVLKRFEKLLAAYRERRHEAETPSPGPGAVASGSRGGTPVESAGASVSGTVIAQAGLAGLGMVPGLGAVAGAMDPQQVAQGADRLRAALGARLRSHDDVQLVLSPLQVLTPVFLQDVAEAAERHARVVWFFDVFEQTGPVLNTWLRDVLIGEEYGVLPANLVAVLSGQGHLDTRCWGDHMELVAEVALEVFTEDEARQLLAARHVSDPGVIEVTLQLTGRLPVLVDLLAQSRPRTAGEIGDPSDTAVERFLKWETDPDRRTAARVCALPLQLDEDLFHVLVPQGGTQEYAWLRGLPFVTGQAGRCRYHDVVRAPMLRLQRTQSPVRWQQLHTLLADTHQEHRRALEDSLPAGKHWNDAAWREYRLNETYHRLCADPHQALPDALRQAIHACDRGIAVLRRWGQILTQAAIDTDSTLLATWAAHLSEPAPDNETATLLVSALARLLTAPGLTSTDQALAHSIRGREHRDAERYQQALTDYTTALTLDPHLARAHSGRGETHRLAGHYDDALTDFNHAIELDPTDAWAIGSRGQTHRAMGHYDNALTDLNHAIQLGPNSIWTIVERGISHRLAGHYDDALTDFNHLIELDPTDAWAIGNRGETHRAMGHYDNALTDFNHAIELDPTYAWAIGSRGQTHRAMGHYDNALTDFNHAIQLDPTYAWAIAQRGTTHHRMGHYDNALTDLNHAIQLDPTYAWAIAQRGTTHRAMGHYDNALTDLNHAIQLDPTYAWAIAQRGTTH